MTTNDEFVRVQVSYRGRLGIEVGVFVAVDHLRRADQLSADELEQWLDIDDWFIEHLPHPPFYADGNSIGAVTWFRTPVPEEMQSRIDTLVAILRAHEVEVSTVRSTDPGTEVYRDDFQIGVVPRQRQEPTPLPDGVILAPTAPGSKRAVTASSIRHVLFDADEVLQIVPGGWIAAMEPYLGDRAEEFLRRTWREEIPTLAGEGDYLPMLAAQLLEYEVQVPVDEVFAAAWHHIEPVTDSFAIIGALRRNGYGVHLGSNQERHRGTYMRTTLGYDDLFDVSCYSWELGVAKPDPQFFVVAAEAIGSAPETILFVDDRLDNVAAAQSVGMAGVHWSIESQHTELIAALAAHGVDARLAVSSPGSRAESRGQLYPLACRRYSSE